MRFSDFAEINPRVALERGELYSKVMMSDVTPGHRYANEEGTEQYGGGGSRFQKGDILFARITPSLENGKIAQFKGERSPSGFGSTEFFVIRAKEGVSDPDYLYCLCLTDLIRKPAEKSMYGASGRQRADLDVVERIEIHPPRLERQRKVGSFLAAFDNLIEKNLLRIGILEEMSRLAYKEWFVHLRFPGHEGVNLRDSELGPIPEGWELLPFSTVADINPNIDFDREEAKPYVSMGEVSNNSMAIKWKGELREGRGGSQYENGDVIFPRITPSVEHGKGAYVQFLQDGQVGIGSTEFIVIRSRILPGHFLYFLSKQEDFRENAKKSMVGASGRQRVQPQCFDRYLLRVPSKRLLRRFSSAILPNLKLIAVLNKENELLLRMRNLVLPMLITAI